MYDYLAKIILAGDSNVGKSSLMHRYVDNSFVNHYDSTIGVDFKVREIQYGKKVIKLQIWDLGGNLKFRSIVRSYYKHANAVVLLFDITNLRSFHNMGEWINDMKSIYGRDVPPMILVGTKLDLKGKRVILSSDGHEMAKREGMIKYIEISSLSGENVNEIFDELMGILSKKWKDNFFEKEILHKIDIDLDEPRRVSDVGSFLCCNIV